MDKLGTACIGGHGGVREVALRARQFRTDTVLTQPEQVLLPLGLYGVALVAIAVDLTVAQGHRPPARRLLKIEAQVLPRVVHGRCPLDAHESVLQDEVQFPVFAVVETDLPHQFVRFLVVQLGQRVHHVQRVAPTGDLAAYGTRTDQHQDGVLTL